MASPTPFFAAFGPLLFGRRPLAEIDKLLGDPTALRSLSQYQEAFGEFIPQALLSREKAGVNSRERIFTPVVTFWAFLAQVLERGSSAGRRSGGSRPGGSSSAQPPSSPRRRLAVIARRERAWPSAR